jgi:hypothetical protein
MQLLGGIATRCRVRHRRPAVRQHLHAAKVLPRRQPATHVSRSAQRRDNRPPRANPLLRHHHHWPLRQVPRWQQALRLRSIRLSCNHPRPARSVPSPPRPHQPLNPLHRQRQLQLILGQSLHQLRKRPHPIPRPIPRLPIPHQSTAHLAHRVPLLHLPPQLHRLHRLPKPPLSPASATRDRLCCRHLASRPRCRQKTI